LVQEKWIVRSETSGGMAVRRKSPKRGRLEDLFSELVSIPRLLSNPNFSLEVLMNREEEVRRYDRKRRRWRRKEWVVEGRRLVDVVDRRLFVKSADWLAFVPNGLESFTTKDIATGANTRRDLAQKMAYCLRHGRMIELIGKHGRANLYRVPGMPDTK
jgi:hypothetical protein